MTRKTTPDSQIIAARIRAARVASGLTSFQLAKALDVHPSQVSRWETHHAPTAEVLGKIARILNVTLDSLVLGSDGASEVAQ